MSELRINLGRRRRLLAATLIAPLACVACQNGQAPNAGQNDSVLTIFAPPSPSEMARLAIDPYDPDKRQRGIRYLANQPFGGERVYLEMYRIAAEDGDAAVRAAAMQGLGMHGDPEDVPRVASHLQDESALVRRAAARALQRLHNPAAITPLVTRLDQDVEEDIDTRASAASALGQYAERRVVQALIGALGDRRLVVNRAALESLRTLTGQDFGYEIKDWVTWTRNERDLFAAQTQYIFPVYYRDANFFEAIIPFLQPPNETAGTPVGMPEPPPATDTTVADGEDQAKGG